MAALINNNKVIFPVFAFLLRLRIKKRLFIKLKNLISRYINLSRKFEYMIFNLISNICF